jgi:hypothetical protein
MQTDFKKKNEDTDKNIKYYETYVNTKKEDEIEIRKKKYLNLLKNQEVIDWTMRKGRWLNVKQKKEDNEVEKKWGNLIIKQTNNNQWTTKLGETILEEILRVQKGNVWRPKQLDGHKPDWETEDGIYEVKTRNWTTSGTAGEKILGTPFKYADIPVLYKKPLYIVTIAYQEYEACCKFELFNSRNPRKIKMIEQWKEMGIEYIKCSDLLKNIKIV